MNKLEWLARNLADWYVGEGWVAFVDMEEIHWHPAYMQGINKVTWQAERNRIGLVT
jgi:hypothetical protein